LDCLVGSPSFLNLTSNFSPLLLLQDLIDLLGRDVLFHHYVALGKNSARHAAFHRLEVDLVFLFCTDLRLFDCVIFPLNASVEWISFLRNAMLTELPCLNLGVLVWVLGMVGPELLFIYATILVKSLGGFLVS
jgi:hypothetical protein